VLYLQKYHLDEVPVSGLIEVVIPYIGEELFTLKRNYRIVVAVDQPNGKWPELIGNSFFTDS
jgi:hypothetical protein